MLTQGRVDVVAFSKEGNQHGSQSEIRNGEPQSGLVDRADYFSEQGKNLRLTFLDNRVQT